MENLMENLIDNLNEIIYDDINLYCDYRYNNNDESIVLHFLDYFENLYPSAIHRSRSSYLFLEEFESYFIKYFKKENSKIPSGKRLIIIKKILDDINEIIIRYLRDDWDILRVLKDANNYYLEVFLEINCNDFILKKIYSCDSDSIKKYIKQYSYNLIKFIIKKGIELNFNINISLKTFFGF